MRTIWGVLVLLLCISCTSDMTSPKPSAFSIESFTGEKIDQSEEEYIYRQILRWTGDATTYQLKLISSDGSNCSGADSVGCVLYENTGSGSLHEFIYDIESTNGILPYIIIQVEITNYDSEDVLIADFGDNRIIGTTLSSTKGYLEGQTTGTAITLTLNEIITDIFVDGFYAHHFMYRLNIVSEDDYSIITSGDWLSTFDLPNIREVKLNSQTIPSLNPNEVGQLTQIEAYIVTRDGYEDSANPATVNFTVQTGFSPNTMIYYGVDAEGNTVGHYNDIWVYGENNYAIDFFYWYADFSTVYYTFEGDEARFATPFWLDANYNYVALGSDDLKVFLHWGWDGEYELNTPTKSKDNIVLDKVTGENYFAEIIYTDVKLNGDAPGWEITNSFLFDGWLRIPVESDQVMRYTLEGLDAGEHTLTVRAIDSQLVADETPQSFTFTIVEPTPESQKTGIIILDDEPDNIAFSPGEFIDDFYFEISSDCNGPIENFHLLDRRTYIANGLNLHNLHGNMGFISPADLDPFELVIYHNDSYSFQNNFWKETPELYLYLESGGNLLVSMSSNWTEEQSSFNEPGYSHFAEKYLGYSEENNVFNRISYEGSTGSQIEGGMAFFESALGIGNYPQIDVQMPGFNNFFNLFNLTMGLWNIVYFTGLSDDNVPIYYFGGVTPEAGTDFSEWDDEDDDDVFPSEDQINYFNQQVVGYKKITGSSCCYVLGFPLSYMKLEEVRSFMNVVISDINN